MSQLLVYSFSKLAFTTHLSIIIMNLEAEKIELARRVLETEDANLLSQIRFLFEDQEQLTWDKLPDHIKEGIRKAELDIENGSVHTHEEVMKKYSKYL